MHKITLLTIGGAVVLSLILVGLVTAQESTEVSKLDCSNKPCEVICPPQSTYRAGNNCTSACDTTYCDKTEVCGCYCRGTMKMVNGECKRRRLACPKTRRNTVTRRNITAMFDSFIEKLQGLRDQEDPVNLE